MRNRIAIAALLLLLPVGTRAQDAWSWAGAVPRGQAIEIKGVNGRIEAKPASGGQVRVTARKSGERSDPATVELRVVEHGGGVTICAVYPSPRGPANDCVPGGGGRSNVSNNDVKVHFTVEVPRDVRLVARNVNGDVSASDLQGDVAAYTVNGDVRVSTAGVANATTVNGSIDVRMGRSDWRENLAFETVNGAITVQFTGDLNAEVHAATVNGSIESDYPLTVRGRFGPKRVSGTVGSGGRQLDLSTVNGRIALLRR